MRRQRAAPTDPSDPINAGGRARLGARGQGPEHRVRKEVLICGSARPD